MTVENGYITADDVSSIILAQLYSDGVFDIEEEEPRRIIFPETFRYGGERYDYLTHETLVPYVQQLAMMLNVCVGYRVNNSSGMFEASVHKFRKKLDTTGIKIDLKSVSEDPNPNEAVKRDLDEAAKKLGFRTWEHIPKGALRGRWLDPDPFSSLEEDNWLKLNMLLCITLTEMTEFEKA